MVTKSPPTNSPSSNVGTARDLRGEISNLHLTDTKPKTPLISKATLPPPSPLPLLNTAPRNPVKMTVVSSPPPAKYVAPSMIYRPPPPPRMNVNLPVVCKNYIAGNSRDFISENYRNLP